jgi:hypothetical protein
VHTELLLPSAACGFGRGIAGYAARAVLLRLYAGAEVVKAREVLEESSDGDAIQAVRGLLTVK